MATPLHYTFPLVSVITPAYNQADYLAETIESVLNQDYPRIEYIVLDDGSKDHTRTILEQFNGRILWESHENMGEARTVNKGFAMAKGDYVIVVNADDPVLSNMIRTQVEYLEAHPKILATYPDWIVIDEHSQKKEYIQAWDYDYRKMVRRTACIPGPASMIRRKALDLVQGRNPDFRFVTDMDFWFRLGLHGDLARIPQPLATHRTHESSSGVSQKAKVGEEIIRYITYFFSLPTLPPQVQILRTEALSSAYFHAGVRAETYNQRRHYFIQSFLKYPLNWIKNRECRAPWIVGCLILPQPVYTVLRSFAAWPYKFFKKQK